MRRAFTLVLVTGLALAAAIVPKPDPPAPGAAQGIDSPAVSVCRVEEGQGVETSVTVLSPGGGSGTFTTFAGGGATGSVSFETDRSGSADIRVVDVSAVGVGGGLAEVPDVTAGVGSVIAGLDSLAMEGCGSTPYPQTLLAGGSTLTGESLEIQLMNPFSGDAAVEMMVSSEQGVEANPVFDNVIVPSRSSTILDLAEILPGRASLSVLVETTVGSVLTVGVSSNGTDSALWQAIAPAQDWFVAVPGGEGRREVVVASSSPGAVSYEVDLYGPEGLIEGFADGVINGRGMVTLDVTAMSTDPVALRIITTAPVAPFLRYETDEGVGMTTGSAQPATTWEMPGAGSVEGSISSVLIINPGIEDGTVTLIERRTPATSMDLVVPADSMVVHGVSASRSDGISILSDVPVVALWITQGEGLLALSAGVPTGDG